MKKVFIITMLLLTTTLIGQTIPTKTSETFKWKNGKGEVVNVDFDIIDTNNMIPNESIEEVVISSLVKAKWVLKNKLSYVPINIDLIYFEKNIAATVDFRGRNAYNAESEIQGVWVYDIEGKFLYRLK
jgi:hypothetical protein